MSFLLQFSSYPFGSAFPPRGNEGTGPPQMQYTDCCPLSETAGGPAVTPEKCTHPEL